jgi:hypothetical protein
VVAHKVLAAPTGSTGAVDYRLLVPDDISGSTGPNQVLQRNSGDTANVWQTFTPVVTIDLAGTHVGDRQILNLIGAGVTAVDNPGLNRVDITIPGSTGIDPIAAALIFGG